ncbi:MAG: hypothetical protein PHI18_00370 [bacterium]|nr:hypothetical protein [bacterium]
MSKSTRFILLLLPVLLVVSACEEGIDDWSGSATISGYVYTDAGHTGGVEGVQVVFESDPDAQNPYEGPDRWVVSDGNGHFQGNVFLGNKEGEYHYVADLSVGYFWKGKTFSWEGGVTVGPGSHFTLPAVDTTMFAPIVGGQ